MKSTKWIFYSLFFSFSVITLFFHGCAGGAFFLDCDEAKGFARLDDGRCVPATVLEEGAPEISPIPDSPKCRADDGEIPPNEPNSPELTCQKELLSLLPRSHILGVSDPEKFFSSKLYERLQAHPNIGPGIQAVLDDVSFLFSKINVSIDDACAVALQMWQSDNPADEKIVYLGYVRFKKSFDESVITPCATTFAVGTPINDGGSFVVSALPTVDGDRCMIPVNNPAGTNPHVLVVDRANRGMYLARSEAYEKIEAVRTGTAPSVEASNRSFVFSGLTRQILRGYIDADLCKLDAVAFGENLCGNGSPLEFLANLSDEGATYSGTVDDLGDTTHANITLYTALQVPDIKLRGDVMDGMLTKLIDEIH